MPAKINFDHVEKFCLHCGEKLKIICNRDIERKNYCSRKCANTHTALTRTPKAYKCIECNIDFLSKTVAKRCEKCRSSIDLQISRSYSMLHNNPEKYFQHALYKKGREELTVEFMMQLLKEQEGKCAITKEPLTFIKIQGNGKVFTNASIDQIRAGEGYTKDNVHIVCDIVNRMKFDMNKEEFLFWCNRIIAEEGGWNDS